MKSLSVEYIRDWTAANTPSTLISKSYSKCSDYLMFRCRCGELYLRSWQCFRVSSGLCNDCAYNKVAEAISISEDEFRAVLQTQHAGMIELVGDYVNATTPATFLNTKTGTYFKANPQNVMRGKSLGVKVSTGEIMIAQYLDTWCIYYTRQWPIQISAGKTLYADFYLPEHNLVIEFDGVQHFIPIAQFGGDTQFGKQQANDVLKNDFCAGVGLTLLRIPFWDKKYVCDYLAGELLPDEQLEPDWIG